MSPMRVDVPDSPAGPFTELGRLGSPACVAHNSVPVWAALFKQTSLSTREREAFRHRLAHLVGCEYCSGLRSSALTVDDSDGSVPAEFYDQIFNSSWSGYSERERLIIEVIERFADDHEELRDDEAFWQRMHAAFTEDEIVDVCYHMVGPQMGRVIAAKVVLGFSEICEVVPASPEAQARREAQLRTAQQTGA
jgi:hypothetical protein